MRILIVTEFYYPFINGVTRQVEGLANALADAGHTVLILAPGYRSTIQEDRPGITIMRVPGIPNPFSKDLPLYLPSLGPAGRVDDAVRTWQPDIIHVQTNFMLAWSTKRSALRHRIPIIFTYHNFLYRSKGSWWRIFDLTYHGYLSRLYLEHHVTIPSEIAIQHLVGEYSDARDFIYMPNGIDESEFGTRVRSKDQAKHELSLDNRKVLLYVGRLSGEKRLIDAIKGMHLVSDERVHLVLVGAGLQEKSLRAFAKKFDRDRIIFAGKMQRQQLKIYYEAADAFLLPSPVENQSLAQIEALSYGLPVLGVKAKASEATIVDGVNGLLFPARHPAAMAKTIREFFALTKAQREEMEGSARLSVKPFMFSQLLPRYLRLYRDVVLDLEISEQR